MSTPRSGTTHGRSRTRSPAAQGFTLLEMVVVITIIAILAASLVPVLLTPYVTEKRLETVNELRAIERAILGVPELGDYGFLGTIGRLPAGTPDPEVDFAQELTVQGTLPTVTATPGGGPVGVPVGWNGPYVKSEYQDPTRDAWGMPYRIVKNTADPSQWRLVSSGQDRVAQITASDPNNGGQPCDDIVFPSQQVSGVTTGLWFSSKGNVYLDLWGDYGNWQKAMYKTSSTEIVSIAIWVPDGSGSISSITCDPMVDPGTGVETNTFLCPNVPFGLHTVSVTLNGAMTQFSNYLSVNYIFNQNVANARANTYSRIMIPLAPTTFSNTEIMTTTTLASTNTTTATSVLTGRASESAYYNAGMIVTNGPGTRTLLAEARAWGIISMPDATTDCWVNLEPYTSSDNGTNWTLDTTAVATLKVPATGSGALSMPFSISNRYGALPTQLTMFRLSVQKGPLGTGACSVPAGRAQATVFRQLATP